MSQNVNVNLVPGNYPKEFHVSQYDVGRQLVANIVDSTGAYSIPSGATVTLVGTKPSGFGFTLSGTVGSGGVVTFSTTATVTAEYGRIPCEVRITSGSTILGTANCMLIVEESPHPEGTTDGDGEVIINQITLLLEQITQQADRAVAASEAAQASETAAAASEANAATSESNAAASEATALSAKNDAVAAKTAAQASEAAAAESAAEAEATLGSYAKVGGEYDGMTVGTAKQLLSDSTTTDTEPYIYRQTAGDADREEVEEVVGGTVAWNQLVQNGNFASTSGWSSYRNTLAASGNIATATVANEETLTSANISHSLEVQSGHKYVLAFSINSSASGNAGYYVNDGGIKVTKSISAGAWTQISTVRSATSKSSTLYLYLPEVANAVVQIKNVMAVDLTAMFGTTIADYIYSLEQSQAGAGVAWFKKLFPKDYYPYDAGSLQSVKTSGHVTKDADENVIGNYPLSPIDLRGIPQWVNGKLVFDGDVYPPSGEVQRRYGIVDLWTLTWTYQEQNCFYASVSGSLTNGDIISNKFIPATSSIGANREDLSIALFAYFGDGRISIKDARYDDSTISSFVASLDGSYAVYELATPITETVDPYTAIQVCDPNGTEEWTDERTVQIPVGNVTKYHANLKEKLEEMPAIPTAPSANGTYTLKATVSGGAVTYQWVNG